MLASLDKDKCAVPEPFPYEEARRLFKGEVRHVPSKLAGGNGARLMMPQGAAVHISTTPQQMTAMSRNTASSVSMQALAAAAMSDNVAEI